MHRKRKHGAPRAIQPDGNCPGSNNRGPRFSDDENLFGLGLGIMIETESRGKKSPMIGIGYHSLKGIRVSYGGWCGRVERDKKSPRNLPVPRIIMRCAPWGR